jgi:hypothetical protein
MKIWDCLIVVARVIIMGALTCARLSRLLTSPLTSTALLHAHSCSTARYSTPFYVNPEMSVEAGRTDQTRLACFVVGVLPDEFIPAVSCRRMYDWAFLGRPTHPARGNNVCVVRAMRHVWGSSRTAGYAVGITVVRQGIPFSAWLCCRLCCR